MSSVDSCLDSRLVREPKDLQSACMGPAGVLQLLRLLLKLCCSLSAYLHHLPEDMTPAAAAQAAACHRGLQGPWGLRRAWVTWQSWARQPGLCLRALLPDEKLLQVTSHLVLGSRMHSCIPAVSWCMHVQRSAASASASSLQTHQRAMVACCGVCWHASLLCLMQQCVRAGWQAVVEASAAALVASGIFVLGYQVRMGREGWPGAC